MSWLSAFIRGSSRAQSSAQQQSPSQHLQPADVPETETCRFCCGAAPYIFHKKILHKYDVAYFRCESCESIQTELPYWLDEAYAIPGVHIDVGIVARTIRHWIAAATLFEMVGLDRKALVVDFGAASGLFARLMRDVGYNARSYDAYSAPFFTSYFNVDDIPASRPVVVTAFEVFEHLVEPRQEISALIAARPRMLVFQTWFCDGQGEDWPYLAESCGQHVFFYSERAMREFADSHGYDLVRACHFNILVQRDAGKDLADAVEKFVAGHVACVNERIRGLVEFMVFSNEYIDADAKEAAERFDRELEEAARSRPERLG